LRVLNYTVRNRHKSVPDNNLIDLLEATSIKFRFFLLHKSISEDSNQEIKDFYHNNIDNNIDNILY